MSGAEDLLEEDHIASRCSEVRGAKLAEEHLFIPGGCPRARHPDGLGHGRHHAAVERVVRVLQGKVYARELGR